MSLWELILREEVKVPLFKAFKMSWDNVAHLFIQQTIVQHLLSSMTVPCAEDTKIYQMPSPSSGGPRAVVQLPGENQ